MDVDTKIIDVIGSIIVSALPNGLQYICPQMLMIETKELAKTDRLKVEKYFSRPEISALLLDHLNELFFSPIGTCFTFSLAEGLHLFIYFHRSRPMEGEDEKSKCMEQGCYAIKITKAFPVSGLRVHLLRNNYTPRLFDCRDITDEILRGGWTYKNRLLDIIANIDRFQTKLALRNNQDIAMQNTGEFKMGDLFDIHELKVFPSLNLFEDLTREDGPALGTTETHFLTFKQIPAKQGMKQGRKMFQLVRACQLQCLSEVFHNKKSGEVIVTFYKYKTIKSPGDHEKVSRKYKLEDSQQFLRHILKHIVRFQKIRINLQLGTNWSNEPVFEKLNKKLEEIRGAERALETSERPKEKREMSQQLVQLYHKIVEYFSERANPYYLIFVDKLNKMGTYPDKLQPSKSF